MTKREVLACGTAVGLMLVCGTLYTMAHGRANAYFSPYLTKAMSVSDAASETWKHMVLLGIITAGVCRLGNYPQFEPARLIVPVIITLSALAISELIAGNVIYNFEKKKYEKHQALSLDHEMVKVLRRKGLSDKAAIAQALHKHNAVIKVGKATYYAGPVVVALTLVAYVLVKRNTMSKV